MLIHHASWRRCVALVCTAVAGVSFVARAQTESLGVSEMETRATLEAEMRKAEAAHRTSEAWLLKTRLQKGDFQDGDRIVVKLLGSVTFTGSGPGHDTVIVRAGKMLPLPQMGDFPLEGVLRSELTSKLSSHLARYLKDSSVQAIPLLRLYVSGQVRAPGFYYTSADVLVNDVIMKAGGPTGTADLTNVVIRRSGEVIWNEKDMRTALTDGLALDRLHLRAGDEVNVSDMQSNLKWNMLATYAVPIVGIIFTLLKYTR